MSIAATKRLIQRSWINCRSIQSVSCRSTPCKRPIAATPASHWGQRRWPMCCGHDSSSTIQPIRSGPIEIGSFCRPVTLVLTRQNVPTLDRNRYGSAEGLRRGAYILAEAANRRPEVILMATGSEVSLIVEARQQLQKQDIQTRLVSMPSWELFDAKEHWP